MSIIKINEKDYELDSLSEDAKARLGILQFVDAKLQRFTAQTTVLQTARMAYNKSLNEALAANQIPN